MGILVFYTYATFLCDNNPLYIYIYTCMCTYKSIYTQKIYRYVLKRKVYIYIVHILTTPYRKIS